MKKNLMLECFRWFGPNDGVSLRDIRQSGATAVFTSLHQIPYGEVWSQEAIRERQDMIREAGLEWTVVESLPVHEAIKTRSGRYQEFIANYKTSMENLAQAGITKIIYNFMPVLDWVRTDLKYKLPDGAECLKFDPSRFAVFDIYILQREGATKDYSETQLQRANEIWEAMSEAEKQAYERAIIDVFPGMKLGLSVDDIREMLSSYHQIDLSEFKQNLQYFLEQIIPCAQDLGLRFAIHPDDPPMSIMGLHRIVSKDRDLQDILNMVDSEANGLCFCTGSLSPLPENNLADMVERYGERINAVHLRSTQREEDGSFHEARHLEGSVDMFAVVQKLLETQKQRIEANRDDWQLCFRPDHGHTMMDDLSKPDPDNPGYSCIGRMKGLAELRGLQTALSRVLG